NVIKPDARTAWTFLTDEEQSARRLRTNFSWIDAVHGFHNQLVTGDPALHFLEHFRRRHLPPDSRPVAASFGCGEGHLERALLGLGWRFEALTGMELNPALVEHAQAKVAALEGGDRVRYQVADLNHLSLEPASLDLGMFFHSLHHVEGLEACLAEVSLALRHGGALLVIDYFGGNRLQRGMAHLSICDLYLRRIPEPYRVDLTRSSRNEVVLKERCTNTPVDQVIASDPSEAIRSEELAMALRSTPGLVVVEERPLGGTLLDPLFDRIAGNFVQSDPVAQACVQMAMAGEESLIASLALEPDYRYVVLRRH
ncbi:MAG TPA: class I SAM-dependent methyltransferase, partial [Myxococcaceae bacterium]|nr:class I SAM-dependent methyltransferase [Myxococcaceae bacterium]